ncbi:BglG family transcription antiterminator [Gemelliphila palaticanis]|uniref:PRD domain-containing protein n=1 Tax=Gemelliphila palaticanis TaxID=81950 RepID=A0ABX2T1J7_9BACL|nr:PTS sugar transporter subunit IIA [Gemella palaticanis]MBF0715587.1 PRD domain-containing protein [Gemella palaticanis]NYS47517.1 PRD domain-containing protein [Gemella palaticanis]
MEIFNYDNRSLRLLNILEGSILVKDKYIIDKLKVSYKTIQNEVKSLNSMFKESAYIKYQNNEYSLYIVNFEEYLKIKSKLYDMYKNFDSNKVRMIYIFKKLIETKNMYLIDDLAFEMVVSRGTLNSDIKKLKEIIYEYDMSIIGKSNSGIRLVGKEKDIRLFIIYNIYNYIYKEEIFELSDLKYFDELFLKYDIDLNIKLEFQKYLTTVVDRVGNDFLLDFEDDEYNELLDFYAIDFINEISNYIEERYRIKISANDKKFLMICFATMRVPTRIDKVSNNITYHSRNRELVSKILLKIYEEYGLEIDISEIMQEFTYHIYFLMQRQRYGIRYKNNMKDIIKEKYTMSYKIATIAAKVIYDEYGYNISEDEVCYLAIYFETFISKLNLKIENIKIVLVTQVGPAYKELMLSQLKSILKNNIEIKLHTDIENTNLGDFDVVISTVKKEFPHNKIVIYQDELLDLEYIKKELGYLKYMGKVNTPKIRGMESILISSISDQAFFLLDSNKTYSENLHFIISELSRKNLVDEEFILRIKEREKVSSMIFSESLAFPHTINKNYVDKFIISVGISEDGFKDNPNLKLIILAAIPENNSNSLLLVRIYDELISIIKEELIEELVKIKNYSELIAYFIKNTNLYR